MKIKHLFTFGLIALLFFSCNPNKAIYEELDAARGPYNETFSYTLTDADYSTIKSLALKNAENAEDSSLAYDLGVFNSFSSTRKAALMIPAFLEASFIALDSSSAISVEYNYLNAYTMTPNQKIFLNPVFTNFDDIVVELAARVTDAKMGDIMLVTYFWNGTKKITKELALFKYDGINWSVSENPHFFEGADYYEMGTGEGQPGADSSFSVNIPAEKYIPTYLKQRNPYAEEGQTAEFVYLFLYGGNTYIHDVYVYKEGEWKNEEQKSMQFQNDGEKWFFDPSIRFEMSSDDYQIIVNWIANNDTLSGYLDQKYNNTEYYFGASSYYGNFDMRDYKRIAKDTNGYLTGLTDDEVMDVLYARLPLAIEILLEQKYPDAVPVLYGKDVYFEITFDAYEPPHKHFMVKFRCTDVGTFEFVEGPTLVE